MCPTSEHSQPLHHRVLDTMAGPDPGAGPGMAASLTLATVTLPRLKTVDEKAVRTFRKEYTDYLNAMSTHNASGVGRPVSAITMLDESITELVYNLSRVTPVPDDGGNRVIAPFPSPVTDYEQFIAVPNRSLFRLLDTTAVPATRTAGKGRRPQSWSKDQWLAKCKEDGVNKLLVPNDSDNPYDLLILSTMLETGWEKVKRKHGWKIRESDYTGETFPDEAMKKEYQILVAMLHPTPFRSHVQNELRGIKPKELVDMLWTYLRTPAAMGIFDYEIRRQANTARTKKRTAGASAVDDAGAAAEEPTARFVHPVHGAGAGAPQPKRGKKNHKGWRKDRKRDAPTKEPGPSKGSKNRNAKKRRKRKSRSESEGDDESSEDYESWIRCHKCRGYGHIAKDCVNRRWAKDKRNGDYGKKRPGAERGATTPPTTRRVTTAEELTAGEPVPDDPLHGATRTATFINADGKQSNVVLNKVIVDTGASACLVSEEAANALVDKNIASLDESSYTEVKQAGKRSPAMKVVGELTTRLIVTSRAGPLYIPYTTFLVVDGLEADMLISAAVAKRHMGIDVSASIENTVEQRARARTVRIVDTDEAKRLEHQSYGYDAEERGEWAMNEATETSPPDTFTVFAEDRASVKEQLREKLDHVRRAKQTGWTDAHCRRLTDVVLRHLQVFSTEGDPGQDAVHAVG